jgi:hypothetical protein
MVVFVAVEAAYLALRTIAQRGRGLAEGYFRFVYGL